MRYTKYILVIFPFFLLCACTPSETYHPTLPVLNAQATLVEATQWQYYSGAWSSVKVDYKVKNTGKIVIDGCQITFHVICKDGNIYQGHGWLWDIDPKVELSGYTYIDTADKEASEVILYKIEFYNWGYGTKEIILNIATPVVHKEF